MKTLQNNTGLQKLFVSVALLLGLGALLLLVPGVKQSLFKADIVPGANNLIAESSATVRIVKGEENSPTCVNGSFQANPNPTNIGADFTLSWDSTNQQSARIFADGVQVYALTTQEQQVVSGGIQSDTNYTIEIFNQPNFQGNMVQCNEAIVEIAPATCSSFEANPNPVDRNQSFTLTWDSVNQVSATVSVRGSPPPIATLEGEQTFTVSSGITQDTVYLLDVYNEPGLSGDSRQCEVTVRVDTTGSTPTCSSFQASIDGTVITEVAPSTPFLLSWNSSHQATATLFANSLIIGDVNTETTFPINPGITETTDYQLIVSNDIGLNATCNTRVTIDENAPTTLSINKIATDGNGNIVTDAAIGETVTYIITVTNIGTVDALNVVIQDNFDETQVGNIAEGDCTLQTSGVDQVLTCEGLPQLASVAPGDSVQFTYTADVQNINNYNGSIDNTATADADNADPVSDSVSLTPARAFFDLTKSVNPAAPEILPNGEVATYTVTITNNGTRSGDFVLTDILTDGPQGDLIRVGDASNIIVTPDVGTVMIDPMNNNRLDYISENLAPGDSVTLTYQFEADTTGMSVGQVSDFVNQACLMVGGVPNLACDTATVRLGIPEETPDLAVELLVNGLETANLPPNFASPLDFEVTWSNPGQTVMEDVFLEVVCTDDSDGDDPLQAITVPAGSQATLDSIDDVTNTVIWNLGTVAADAVPQTLMFEALLTTNYGIPADSFGCTATITSSTDEPNEANNTDSVTVNVNDGVTGVTETKQVILLPDGDPQNMVNAMPGDSVRYVLTATAGSTVEVGYVFTDDVSDLLEYGSTPVNISDGGSFNNGTNTITWPAMDIPANTSRSVTFEITIMDPLPTTGDFIMSNVFGTGTEVNLPNLVTTKTVAVNGGTPASVLNAAPGDILTYRLRVQNTGAASYTDPFILEDDISDVLVYTNNPTNISNNPNNDVFDSVAETMTWEIASIPAGQTITRSFQVQILSEAELEALGVDEYSFSNTYGDTTTVTIADIVLSKEVRNINNQQASTQNIIADAGDRIRFTIRAQDTFGTVGDPDVPHVFEDNVRDIQRYADIDESTIMNGSLDPDGVIRWDSPTIPGGGSDFKTFEAVVRDPSTWNTTGDATPQVINNIYGNEVTVDLSGVDTTVDLFVEKSAAPASGVVAGDTITYTVTYGNATGATAINVTLIDDFDENLITVDANSLPAACSLEPTQIECSFGNIPAGGGGSFTYTATVNDTSLTNIVNTVTISSDTPEDNPTDNTDTATVTPAAGGLTIRKTANGLRSPNLVTVSNSQTVTYEITVENTSGTTQTFDIQDTNRNIITNPSLRIVGNNGGYLTSTNQISRFYTFDPSIPNDPGQLVSTVGMDVQGSFDQGFNVNNLTNNTRVVITYTFEANNSTIPGFNQTSLFDNTAVIEQNGNQDSAATVRLLGPTTGTPPGGGGGGGGGGVRIVDANLNVFSKKEVKGLDGWEDADTADLAAIVADKPQQDLQYRITVSNSGNVSAKNVEIRDTFTSNQFTRLAIKNVKGADFDPSGPTFMIDTVNARGEVIITYDMTVQKLTAAGDIAEGVNTVTIVNFDTDNLPQNFLLRDVEGIGSEDPAYIRSGRNTPQRGEVSLLKRVDKDVVLPGEEVEYIITVRNLTANDLTDLIVTDLFPFEHLEYISSDARAVQIDGEVQYRKRILRPNGLWAIRVKARVKPTVAGGTVIRNFVTIEASNEDISDLRDSTEITVETRPVPRRLQNTGPESVAFLLLMLGAGMLYGARRRFGLKL